MNSELKMTLDEAVQEVLSTLTGLDMTYDAQYDRFRVVARMLNRALKANALEHEWSYYASLAEVGTTVTGATGVTLADNIRPRQVNDDAVRLVDMTGRPLIWAYWLPRDAIHKYRHRAGLWAAIDYHVLRFSRPFVESEAGLSIQVPVMREPVTFKLPPAPRDAEDPLPPVDDDLLEQELDFFYPDVIVARAAYLYSLTDPVMQPRAQTLEAAYKDLMYQVIERDVANTDTPFMNEFAVPVQGTLFPEPVYRPYPLADERR